MIVIDKFHEEGINQDILYDWGFFTPYFALSCSFNKDGTYWWFQFANDATYCVSLAFNTKEYQRLKDMQE